MCCDLFEEIVDRLLPDIKIDCQGQIILHIFNGISEIREVLVYSVWVQYCVVQACKNMNLKTCH
jgi:hypothetical protein